MRQLISTFATFATLGVCSYAGPLDGVWVNTDAAIQSIPKIEISTTTTKGNQFFWWGKTSPTDSRYGPLRLILLGDSVDDASPNKYGYVIHDAKFADHFFIMKRAGNKLMLESITIFKDGSKRSNYQETLIFKKES